VLSRQWSLCWQERLCKARDIQGEVSEVAAIGIGGREFGYVVTLCLVVFAVEVTLETMVKGGGG
jgi:hypothetical protein